MTIRSSPSILKNLWSLFQSIRGLIAALVDESAAPLESRTAGGGANQTGTGKRCLAHRSPVEDGISLSLEPVVKAKPIDVSSEIGGMGENVRRKRNRRCERSEIRAGAREAAKIGVKIFPLDRPAASQLEFGAPTGGPTGLHRRLADAFEGGGKRVREK